MIDDGRIWKNHIKTCHAERAEDGTIDNERRDDERRIKKKRKGNSSLEKIGQCFKCYLVMIIMT